jgi:ABC-type tungstate transport system substrate-binding protein
MYYYGVLLLVGQESAPRTDVQILFSTGAIILGAILMSFIFGSMASLITQLNRRDSYLQETLDFVQNTMRNIKLPEQI